MCLDRKYEMVELSLGEEKWQDKKDVAKVMKRITVSCVFILIKNIKE